jgi:CheY-like chemotaxis protein
MRALVVEDIEINRIVMEMILQQLHCEVHSAANGLVGVSKFKNEEFDVIFMDLQMPECDGFEATRRIRQIEAKEARRALPIFAVSANISEKDRENSIEAGMNGFLAKPVTVLVVREVIESLASFAAE